MTVEELATRAADLIERRGHTKKWFVDTHGRLCIEGAMLRSIPPDEPFGVYGLLWKRVEATVRMSPAAWNDAPERTAEQAIALLRGIAGSPVAVTDPAHVHTLEG